MNAKARLVKLREAAQAEIDRGDEHNPQDYHFFVGCEKAYTQAISIVGEPGPEDGDLRKAVLQFCSDHCFHGRRDGQGNSPECGICPIAVWSLEFVDDGPVDDPAEEKRRAERQAAAARVAAQRANRSMADKGVDTLAGNAPPVRRGTGGLVAGD